MKKKTKKKKEDESAQHLFVVPIDAMELLLSQRVYNAPNQEVEFAKIIDEMGQRIFDRNEASNDNNSIINNSNNSNNSNSNSNSSSSNSNRHSNSSINPRWSQLCPR